MSREGKKARVDCPRCGHVVAKTAAFVFEIKCRHCKRIVRITLSHPTDGERCTCDETDPEVPIDLKIPSA